MSRIIIHNFNLYLNGPGAPRWVDHTSLYAHCIYCECLEPGETDFLEFYVTIFSDQESEFSTLREIASALRDLGSKTSTTGYPATGWIFGTTERLVYAVFGASASTITVISPYNSSNKRTLTYNSYNKIEDLVVKIS